MRIREARDFLVDIDVEMHVLFELDYLQLTCIELQDSILELIG